MFKKVEYAGFEGRPDLRAKAEQLMPVMEDVIGPRQDVVEVRWAPAATAAGALDLTLRRALPNGVEGEFTGTFAPADLSEARGPLRRGLRVWDELLGVLLEKQAERVREAFLEPAEA